MWVCMCVVSGCRGYHRGGRLVLQVLEIKMLQIQVNDVFLAMVSCLCIA